MSKVTGCGLRLDSRLRFAGRGGESSLLLCVDCEEDEVEEEGEGEEESNRVCSTSCWRRLWMRVSMRVRIGLMDILVLDNGVREKGGGRREEVGSGLRYIYARCLASEALRKLMSGSHGLRKCAEAGFGQAEAKTVRE